MSTPETTADKHDVVRDPINGRLLKPLPQSTPPEPIAGYSCGDCSGDGTPCRCAPGVNKDEHDV